MNDLDLPGLDGTNPLAFLAALGALAATANDSPDVSLRWQHDGIWHPVLRTMLQDIDALIDRLDDDRHSCVNDPALALTYTGGKKDLKPQPPVFREFLEDLVDAATTSNRRSVDWAAAFATDVAVDNNDNTKPTALHFTAGQQQFLQMVSELVRNVTKDDLREALVGPWQYRRPLPVPGWDATSSRDYALRASDPSTDKKLGVPGADWLAIRGLAFFPTFPSRDGRIQTTGCTGGWKNGRFRWPLWSVAVKAAVIRTVLGQNVEEMSAGERAARGIAAVFSSGIKRSDQGGYGSFEPASVV